MVECYGGRLLLLVVCGTVATIAASPLACGECSAAVCAHQACPASAPCICTEGPAKGGCDGVPWSESPSCSACCNAALCATKSPTAIAPSAAPTPQPPVPPVPFVVSRNVMDYGAKGDGIADDTAAIVLALTQGKATTEAPAGQPWNNSQYNCQTTRPSFVFMPCGLYKVSSTLPLTFHGERDGLGSLSFPASQVHRS
jgi:hypothetical protein